VTAPSEWTLGANSRCADSLVYLLHRAAQRELPAVAQSTTNTWGIAKKWSWEPVASQHWNRVRRHSQRGSGAGNLPLHAFAAHGFDAILALLHDATDWAHRPGTSTPMLLKKAYVLTVQGGT